MRKVFSKLMSTTLSAAMLITLGAGTVGNVASAAEDDQADVSGVTYGYTAYVGFQTEAILLPYQPEALPVSHIYMLTVTLF